jgi:carbonic anhydrase
MCDCRCSTNLEWSYNNQSNWKSFRNYYNVNKTPINIDTSKVLFDTNKISIHYSNSQKLNSIENAKYIEYVAETEDSYIMYNGNKYILDQFHFHNSSENTKNEVYYPLECHFVNIYYDEINDQKHILVIGLLFSLSEFIGSEITHNITENFGKDVIFDLSVYNNIIYNKYFNFVGSLTVPPFTPNINFNLFFYEDMNDDQKIYFTIKNKDYFNYLKYFPNNKANIISVYNSNRLAEPLQNNYIAVKQIGN